MVSFHLSSSSKVKTKNYRFVSCFEVVRENYAYIIVLLSVVNLTRSLLFLRLLETFKFQDVNEKNMSHLLVPKSQKSSGKSGGQKSDLVTDL